MERESLLLVLVMLLGGLALQTFAWLPPIDSSLPTARELERRAWIRLWVPLAPALGVLAWLGGWALREPDPVRDPLGRWVLIAVVAPFALLFARAGMRALWSLLRQVGEAGVSTHGLIRPQICFSPFLAKQLDEVLIRAALAHESAHALHRDPLRIWLAQLVTDLQWPWPAAPRRLASWLMALELARDEEARAAGIRGEDLAAAMLASLRFVRALPARERAACADTGLAHARLLGEARVLRERVQRLLAPPAAPACAAVHRDWHRRAAGLLAAALLLATLSLGLLYGEQLMRPLLALTS